MSTTEQPKKPSVHNRLPSLNQLAARIGANKAAGAGGDAAGTGGAGAPATNGTAASGGTAAAAAPGARPRLNFALRGTSGSTTSLSTTASTNDSVVVNPPTTRSGSPSVSVVSGAGSDVSGKTDSTGSGGGGKDGANGPTITVDGGDSNLTSEKLEALNIQESSDKDGQSDSTPTKPDISALAVPGKAGSGGKDKPPKFMPSLETIASRLAKAREKLSIDGTAKPPEPELIEDPKTPGIQIKAPEHPLQYNW
jgi:translation initiation factor 4E